MNLKKHIHRFKSISLPVYADPDPAQMEYLTRMTMLFLLAGSTPFVLLAFAAWLCGFIPADTLLILLAVSGLFLAGILLTRKGYWQLSSLIPPAVLFATAVYGNYVGGIDAPAMLIYVLAIILVAMLRRERDMFIAIVLSLAAFIAMGLAHRYGFITDARSGHDHFWNRIIVACTSITGISLLVRFLIKQFRNALEKARQELDEKERMQMQLLHAQKMEAIGTLTSGLAHDFNNILSGIMGSLSLLDILLSKENIQQREKTDRYINMAVESSRRASDMIKQLLLLSRRQEIALNPVDINLCMEHVIEICRNSFPKSVLIHASYPDQPAMVMTDDILTEQILLNFCVNASHAMTIMRERGAKEGGILDVRITREERTSRENTGLAGSFIRIDISDTGVGMDGDTQKRIFEPFFTMKKKESGTGLGLSTAYGFIGRVGGFIEIRSEISRGSVFSIFLPEYSGELTQTKRDNSKKAMLKGNATLLLIDDEKAILGVAEDTLVQCGYNVLTAQDGIKGLALFGQNMQTIDLVLLDISMPYMSGLEVFDRIKEMNSSVKVLLSSGYPDDERVAGAMAGGASGFIQKPYTASELSRRIHQILNQ